MGIRAVDLKGLVNDSEQPGYQLSHSAVTLADARKAGFTLLARDLAIWQRDFKQAAGEVNKLKGVIEHALEVYRDVKKFSPDVLRGERTRMLAGYSICLAKVARMLDCKERVERFKAFCLVPERMWASLSPQDRDFTTEVQRTNDLLTQQFTDLTKEQAWLNSAATKSAQQFKDHISNGVLSFCKLVDQVLSPGAIPVEVITDQNPVGDDVEDAASYLGKWEAIYDAVFKKLKGVYDQEAPHVTNVKGLFDQFKGRVSALDHILQQQIGGEFAPDDLDSQNVAIKDFVRFSITEESKIGEMTQMLQQGGEFLGVCPVHPDILAFKSHFPKFLEARAKLEEASERRSRTVLEYARLVTITYNAILREFKGEGYDHMCIYRSLARFDAIGEKGGAPLGAFERGVNFFKGLVGTLAGVPPVYENPRWISLPQRDVPHEGEQDQEVVIA